MLIKNSYAKKAVKAQPVKDDDGYMVFTPVSLNFDANGKFGTAQVTLIGSLKDTNGGEIAQHLYFDFVITKNKNGSFTKLPAFLMNIEAFTLEEVEALTTKEAFTKEEIREILTRVKEIPFKFRSMKKEKGGFGIDYNSICTLDSETANFTI